MELCPYGWPENFFLIFFKTMISCLKIEIHVLEGHLEGLVSQIFHLGLNYYFMKSKKLRFK